MNKQVTKIYQSNCAVEALLVLPFIASIDTYYPDICEWYINTVVPGIVISDDILLIAKEKNKVAGICLAKQGVETKLRCVRVAEEYRGQGLGIKLIDKALDLIGDKPRVTVCHELINDYSRICVNRYKFNLSEVLKGIYRPNKLEYYFNL